MLFQKLVRKMAHSVKNSAQNQTETIALRWFTRTEHYFKTSHRATPNHLLEGNFTGKQQIYSPDLELD